MTARPPLAAALFLCCCVPAGAQVTVKTVDWGFGKKVLPGHFAPVSVLVDNPTRETFDGTARLFRANFVGERRGAVLTEPLYLGAFASRRVQFYVIPLDAGESWVFEAVPEGGAATDPGGLRTELPRPGFPDPTAPATVFLTAPDDDRARVPGLPRMNEALFPPLAGATDGLRAVVLDHDPEWGEVVRESFLGWLRAGGTAHLLDGPDGTPPRFGGSLAGLNDPAGRFAVGSGTVLRHGLQAAEVSEAFTKRVLLDDPTVPPMTAEDLAFERKRADQVGSFPVSYSPTRLEEEILPTLRRMVRPEHNWGLIHILCLAYVAALFPGVFLVGRERRGYPATLGLLIAVTVTFGVALRAVGRRGYGEDTSVRSTALVRALPPGPDGVEQIEVTQWSDAFVTDGGDYTFAVPGEAALYSTGQSAEPVKGTIDSGVGGALTADVPPFSSRAFVARAVRDEPAPPVRLLAGAEGATPDGSGVRLTGLRVQVPEEFASRTKLLAVYGRHAYVLRVRDGVAAVAGSGDPIPLGNLLAGYGIGLVGNVQVQAAPYGEGDYGYGYDPYQQYYGWEEDAELTDRGLDLAARQLIGRDLGFLSPRRLFRLSAPEGRVRLYAVMPLRDADRVLGGPGRSEPGSPPTEPLPNQNGTTILAYDLPLGSAPTGRP